MSFINCYAHCSRDEVWGSIEDYFAKARGVLDQKEDQMELCMLLAHCFEDYYEAETHSQILKSVEEYTLTLLTSSIDDLIEEGTVSVHSAYGISCWVIIIIIVSRFSFFSI